MSSLTRLVDWASLQGFGVGGLLGSLAGLASGAPHALGYRVSAAVFVLAYLVGRRGVQRERAALEARGTR